MRFWIHNNTLQNNISDSGKAIYFTISSEGFNTGKHREWFPLSQIKISKNETDCGWHIIEIPEWLLKQKVKNQGIEELGHFSCVDTVLLIPYWNRKEQKI